MYICAMAILVFIVINGAREVAQMLQQKYMYFFNPINWVTWCLYVATIIMVKSSTLKALNTIKKNVWLFYFPGLTDIRRRNIRNSIFFCVPSGFLELVQPFTFATEIRSSGDLRRYVPRNITNSD